MNPFRNRRWVNASFLPFLVGALLLTAACTAPGLAASTAAEAPGFWLGLWHGMIFPITFFVSLFNHEVGVYAAVNSGAWYNFGFFLGLAVSMGGGARAGRRRSPRSEKA